MIKNNCFACGHICFPGDLLFKDFWICKTCAPALRKIVVVDDDDPPMGGRDEVFLKELRSEPFEGWRVGQ